MTRESAIVVALEWMRRGDHERAICELEALVARDPRSATAHNALGSILALAGRSEPAVAALREALSLRPDYPEASTNLGNLMLEDDRILEALRAFENAGVSGREPPQAHVGRGRAFCLLGRYRDARLAFERASLHPRADARIHSQRCYATLLDPDASAQSIVSVHRAYDTAVTAPLARHAFPLPNASGATRPLVVGYLSADFRQHSVACFLERLLGAHDRSAVQVILYSDATGTDETTERLRGLAHRFVRVDHMPDEELAALIRRERVDVLVDLAGHTQPNRLPVFARRPAPVLFSYLGYPGTTGMSVFDGRITDAWADPCDDPARAGPEPTIRVEGGYFAYTPPAEAPEVSDSPAAASGVVTFGCMNDMLKVNDLVLSTWGQILNRVLKSRLILKARALSSADVRHRVLSVLAASGVGEARVELRPAITTRREHLKTYASVDIALDTFPYGGATTTCEALYMGVPVITLVGERHAGRLGLSILSAVGLDSFVALSTEDYVRLAGEHARDVSSLASLRRELRDRVRRSPLSDAKRLARTIEHASIECYRHWCV